MTSPGDPSVRAGRQAGAFEADVRIGLFRVVVRPEQANERLDRVLADAAVAAELSLSRTRLQELIGDGHVRVDGVEVVAPSLKVAADQVLDVQIPEAVSATPQAQVIPFAIVFEDEHIIVVDKPAGLVVHPSAGHEDGTLVNALIAHCGASLSGINGVRRPGVVHRLDRDTSGLLVVAKTDRAHAGLAAVFADHGRSGSLVREYVAFVWGVPDRAAGTVSAALGRDRRNRLKVAVVADGQGRSAVTHWTCGANYGQVVTEVRCRLETGRTHQIRVHMATIGHPLVGDPVYGAGYRTKAERLGGRARVAVAALDRQALHAAILGFDHPVTGETLLFQSELPDDLARLVDALVQP